MAAGGNRTSGNHVKAADGGKCGTWEACELLSKPLGTGMETPTW